VLEIWCLARRDLAATQSQAHLLEEGVDLKELNMLNEKRHTLDAVLGDSIREFVYESDFADSWRHGISDEPLRYVAASKLAVENFWSFPIDPILPQDLAFTGIFYWRRGRD
jgi:hypothetical protein